MELSDLGSPQQQALIDLAILGMYADGHLASIEDSRVQRLLLKMGYESDFDRNWQYDAAVARVARHSTTIEAAREHATSLARLFTTPDQRRQVDYVLNDLLASDSKVVPAESSYLTLVRGVFQP